MAKLFLFIYNLFFTILIIPASLFILLFSGKYRKEFFYRLPERFSNFEFVKGDKKVIWVHCASLGEVRAVEPILSALKEKYTLVLTAITKTGREYAKKIGKADFVALLPLDIYPLMLKAINIIKPDMIILVETEIWASMLYAANKKKIKVITINGRMSKKSFRIYKMMKFFWKSFMGFINTVLARSKDDADRFTYLTDGKSEIHITGNIKYDRDFSAKFKKEDFFINENTIVFTAGSTREGEEQIIADVYNQIRKKYPEMIFFLAPRHLSRIKKVKDILSANKIEFSLFSAPDNGKGFRNPFILVDVFGKLQNIYSISDICYIGGSIVPKGGQNPIEAAAYGKTVLFGKHMENFQTEAETLIKYGGGITVADANDIFSKLNMLLSQKELLSETGEKALKAVESQKGALKVTIEKIEEKIVE